jgi:hypothetical protein
MHVFELLVTQLINFDPHALELEPRNLLIDLRWHEVDLVGETLR